MPVIMTLARMCGCREGPRRRGCPLSPRTRARRRATPTMARGRCEPPCSRCNYCIVVITQQRYYTNRISTQGRAVSRKTLYWYGDVRETSSSATRHTARDWLPLRAYALRPRAMCGVNSSRGRRALRRTGTSLWSARRARAYVEGEAYMCGVNSSRGRRALRRTGTSLWSAGT
eukprot:1196201-Prorocentrum_minimum.AAC.12